MKNVNVINITATVSFFGTTSWEDLERFSNFWDHKSDYIRFEVLTALKMSMLVFFLEIETVCSSETLVSTDKFTQHNNPEG
jgi:hypothetical protein